MPEDDQDLQELLQKIRGTQPDAVAPREQTIGVTGEDVSPKLFPAEFHSAFDQAEQVKSMRESARPTLQPDVPLDIESGAPFYDRFKASFHRDPADAVKYWQKKYGADKFHITSTGDLIIKMPDPDTKKEKYVLVDEGNVTAKDFAEWGGAMPEVAGSILSMWLGRKVPAIGGAKGFGGLSRDILFSSLGTFTGGSMKDAIARAWNDFPVRFEEIMKTRGAEAPVNVATDYLLAGGGKVLGKIISPFNDPYNQLTKDAIESQRVLKEELGIDFPLTGGEKTGSRFIQRIEAGQEMKPGSSKPYQKITEQKNKALSQGQNVLQGLPMEATPAEIEQAVPTTDKIIQRVRHAVQKQLEPSEERVINARSKLVTEANTDLLKEIEAATIPTRQGDRAAIGEAIRGKVEAMRMDFQTQSAKLYDAVRQLPGGSDRILATPNLEKRARDYMEKEIAGADITQQLPTGLVNQFGAPITTTQVTSETAKNFIPTDVLGRLQELARLGSGKFSLQDLISMRNDVSNAIAVGESIPGVKTHHLKEISKMLTEGMNDAVKSIPDQRLRQAWEQANDFYKNNVTRFQTPLISKILKPHDASGFVGSKEMVDGLIRGQDKFEEIRDFLGASSPEYQMLKRNIADYLFETNFNPGQQTIKAREFLRDMHAFRIDNPRLFKEVFGSKASRIFSIASQAAVGQADKLDAELIEQGIRNPSAFPNVLELVKAEKARDKVYKNDLLKSIGSKTFPGESFDANQFVNRFVRSSSPAEIKPVLDAIKDDNLLWQVRAKTVEDLLREIGSNPTAQDRLGRQLDPRRAFNTSKLQQILENPDRRKVLETILGEDRIGLLEHLGRVMKPGEAKHQTFRAASGLSIGSQIAALEKGGIVPFASGAFRWTLEGLFLTAPLTRQYLSNTVMTPAKQHAIFTALIASEPLMAELTGQFGTRKAKQVLGEMKQKGDQWLQMHYDPRTAESMPGTNDMRAVRALERLSQ